MSALPGMTAEEYAAGLIRRALDSAVTPDLPHIADESALTLREVEAIRDRILSGKRGTHDLGRPRAVPPVPPAGPAERADDETLIANAIGHESAKVRRLAAKAHAVNLNLATLIDDLRAALVAHEEEAAEAARKAKRIAKLEAELAELRGTSKRSVAREKDYYPKTACPGGCGREFVGIQGVNLHQRRTGCGS